MCSRSHQQKNDYNNESSLHFSHDFVTINKLVAFCKIFLEPRTYFRIVFCHFFTQLGKWFWSLLFYGETFFSTVFRVLSDVVLLFRSYTLLPMFGIRVLHNFQVLKSRILTLLQIPRSYPCCDQRTFRKIFYFFWGTNFNIALRKLRLVKHLSSCTLTDMNLELGMVCYVRPVHLTNKQNFGINAIHYMYSISSYILDIVSMSLAIQTMFIHWFCWI